MDTDTRGNTYLTRLQPVIPALTPRLILTSISYLVKTPGKSRVACGLNIPQKFQTLFLSVCGGSVSQVRPHPLDHFVGGSSPKCMVLMLSLVTAPPYTVFPLLLYMRIHPYLPSESSCYLGIPGIQATYAPTGEAGCCALDCDPGCGGNQCIDDSLSLAEKERCCPQFIPASQSCFDEGAEAPCYYGNLSKSNSVLLYIFMHTHGSFGYNIGQRPHTSS